MSSIKLKLTAAEQADEDKKYDFWTIHSDQAFKFAKEHGLVVVLPEDNELQLDIDNEQDMAVFNKNLPKFQMHIAEVLLRTDAASRNGNTHITLRLDIGKEDYIDGVERIAYQMFLGSDRTRELLSYIRWTNGDPHPTLFIENAQQKLLTQGEGQ